MSGWEEELASLLDALGVKQEESPSHPGDVTSHSTHTSFRPKRKYISRLPRRRDMNEERRIEPYRGAIPDAYSRKKETSTHSEQDEDIWTSDPGAMRREIDGIVKQVIRQMQSGDLEPALKDDIMIVLRALRRRAVAQHAATSDEAYLESAGAMLHFCRLILQLTDTEQDISDF